MTDLPQGNNARLIEIPHPALTSMALVAGGGVLFLSGLHVVRALCARLPAKFLERGTRVAPASMRTGSRGAILGVDDEPLVRRVVRRVLELSGWQVLDAASGREGVERLQQSDAEIGCVLLDRVMPGMDGGARAAAAADRKRSVSRSNVPGGVLATTGASR